VIAIPRRGVTPLSISFDDLDHDERLPARNCLAPALIAPLAAPLLANLLWVWLTVPESGPAEVHRGKATGQCAERSDEAIPRPSETRDCVVAALSRPTGAAK
jgi:hypothetical protein